MGQKHKRQLKMADIHDVLEQEKINLKKRASKRHLDTLFQYRWTMQTYYALGKPMENKLVYVPASSDSEMNPATGWRVVRGSPTYVNKITGKVCKRKLKWIVITNTNKMLRTRGKGTIRRFACPADAIIAADNAARRAFAYAEVRAFGGVMSATRMAA